MIRALSTICLLFVGALWSCGGDADKPGILFGSPDGIVEYSLATGEQHVVVESASPKDTFRDPAVSPDGERIVYSLAPPIQRTNGVADAHADLWIANRDGTDAHMAVEHSRPSEALYSPIWLDDDTIFAIARYLRDPQDPTAGSEWRLARFEVETGAREDLIENVYAFDLSNDRSQIVYVAIESPEEQPIYLVSIDGTDDRLLLDTATSGLGGFNSPVFGPAGETVFFAGHEEEAEGGLLDGVTFVGARRAVRVHDAPSSVWSIPASGGEPVLVAKLELFDPLLAINPNGEFLYAISENLIEVGLNATTRTLVEGVSYGRPAFVDE